MVLCLGLAGQARAEGLPAWFDHPPAHTAETLYFTGDASGADRPEDARDLAVQRALANAVSFFQVKVQSELVTREEEVNGRYSSSIRASVRVAGEEVELREVRVERFVLEERAGARKRYDGYVLLSYPRVEYERVVATQRRADTSLAERSLALFREGSRLRRDGRPGEAADRFREGRDAIKRLRGTTRLADPDFGTTEALDAALGAAIEEARTEGKAAQRTVLVRVELTLDGNPALSRRTAGELRSDIDSLVAAHGLTAVHDGLDDAGARSVAAGGAAPASRAGAGYLLVILGEAEFVSQDQGQFIAHATGSYTLVETASGRVLAGGDLGQFKGGHVRRADACEKALARLREQARQDVGAALAKAFAAGAK